MSQFSLSEFSPIRDGVFRAVAEPEGVNIGLIVGREAAMLVDTGSTPHQGSAIRAAVAKVTRVPLRHVAVTHGHFDHLFGLAAFEDLETLGHESLEASLDSPQTRADARRLGVAVDDLRLPRRTFALAATRDLGARRVELVHFGHGHTAGDVVVIVPDTGIVFVGDLLEQSGPPSFGADCDLAGWPSAIDGVLGLLGEDSLVVPGHGEPSDRIFAYTQRAQISALYGQVEYLVGRGVRQEQAYEAGEWPFAEVVVRAVLPLAYDQLAVAGKRPRTHLPLLGH